MKLIHTDNFGGDYPDEKFVVGLPYSLTQAALESIADICNNSVGPNSMRFWKVRWIRRNRKWASKKGNS